MQKSWTTIRSKRTFEFGRDLVAQVLLLLLFGSIGSLSLISIAWLSPTQPLFLILTPIVYITALYTGRAYFKARFAVTEWRRWQEFLKELDEEKTIHITLDAQ